MPVTSRALYAPDPALAAVTSGLAVVLAVLGWLVPHVGVLQILGAVPVGIIAHRTRLRALLAGMVGGATVAFLIGGSGPARSVPCCAAIGGVVGEVQRRNGSRRMVLILSIAIGLLAATAVDLVLLVFGQLRVLTRTLVSVAGGLIVALAQLFPCGY